MLRNFKDAERPDKGAEQQTIKPVTPWFGAAFAKAASA